MTWPRATIAFTPATMSAKEVPDTKLTSTTPCSPWIRSVVDEATAPIGTPTSPRTYSAPVCADVTTAMSTWIAESPRKLAPKTWAREMAEVATPDRE